MRTTFDGGFSGDRDPDYELAMESALRLLKSVDQVSEEDYPVTLRLLKQRYQLIEGHLWGLRLLSVSPLPPIRGFEMDSFLETSDTLEGRLVRLLDMLNDAILKIKVKLDLQTCPFPLSEL